jgi:hypothetical protein
MRVYRIASIDEYKDDYSPEELSEMKARIDVEKKALSNLL